MFDLKVCAAIRSFEYDLAGRLVAEQDGQRIEHRFDALGALQQ
jgi:hypothetical protein